MIKLGLEIQEIEKARGHPDDIKAFIELPIKQGPILEPNGVSIGVVDKIKEDYWYSITVEGRSSYQVVLCLEEKTHSLAQSV